MSLFNCDNRVSCVGVALFASLIVGIVAAFLTITAVISATPVFLWVVFGIAVAFLAITLYVSPKVQRTNPCSGLCTALTTHLVGILGTILLSSVLLAISFAATSVIGAIIVGLLIASFSLVLTSAACLVKCIINCAD